MTGREYAPGIFVSPQIAISRLSALAEDGVTLLVCNRPDREERDQPTAAETAQAAAALGMRFLHLPITALHDIMQRPRLVELARAITTSGGKTVLYCRSGARSAALVAAKEVAIDAQPVERVLARLRAVGYDLPAVRPLLTALAAKAGCARD